MKGEIENLLDHKRILYKLKIKTTMFKIICYNTVIFVIISAIPLYEK